MEMFQRQEFQGISADVCIEIGGEFDAFSIATPDFIAFPCPCVPCRAWVNMSMFEEAMLGFSRSRFDDGCCQKYPNWLPNGKSGPFGSKLFSSSKLWKDAGIIKDVNPQLTAHYE